MGVIQSVLSIFVSWPRLLSRYSDPLWAGRSGIESRWEATFSSPVQTGLGAPSLLQNEYRVSFPEVMRPVHGVNHAPPFSAEVKERVELYIYSSSVPSWPVLG